MVVMVVCWHPPRRYQGAANLSSSVRCGAARAISNDFVVDVALRLLILCFWLLRLLPYVAVCVDKAGMHASKRVFASRWVKP